MERNTEKSSMDMSVYSYSYRYYVLKGVNTVLNVKLHHTWSDPIWSPQLSMNPVPI